MITMKIKVREGLEIEVTPDEAKRILNELKSAISEVKLQPVHGRSMPSDVIFTNHMSCPY